MHLAVISAILNAKEAKIAPRAIKTWRRALDRSALNGWMWIYSEFPLGIGPETYKVLYEEQLFSDNHVESALDVYNKYVMSRKAKICVFTRPDIFFAPTGLRELVEATYDGLYNFFVLPPGACAMSWDVVQEVFPLSLAPENRNITSAIAKKVDELGLPWKCLSGTAKEGR